MQNPTHRQFALFQDGDFFNLFVEGESPDERQEIPTWERYTIDYEWDITAVPFQYEYTTEPTYMNEVVTFAKGSRVPITKDLPYHVRKVIEHLVGIEI